MDELISEFVREAAGALEGARADLSGASGGAAALRRLHGLKGSAACLGLKRIEALAHEAEGRIGAGAAPDLSALETAVAALGPAGQISPATTLEPLFASLEDLARDLGHRLGKRIELVTTGGHTPAPTGFADLRNVLVALVRNACDHGVESAAERIALGKPALAVLRLDARRTPEGVTISLADDGRGVDADKVLRRGADLGLTIGDDADVHRLVFEAGLSTAAALSRLSGRGVGLDLVRDAVEAAGGRAALTSSPGRGSTVTLTLPAMAGRRRRSAA